MKSTKPFSSTTDMIFRGLGVSESSRRCFLVSSRRTERIKSLAGTCRHFNEQWYINIQSPRVLHLEKVIRGKERRNGINTLRDLAALPPSSFDKSNALRHSGPATDSNDDHWRPDDSAYALSKSENGNRQTRRYDAFLCSSRQHKRLSRTPSSPSAAESP